MNTTIYAIYLDYGDDSNSTLQQGYVNSEAEAIAICEQYNKNRPGMWHSCSMEYEELAPYKPE